MSIFIYAQSCSILKVNVADSTQKKVYGLHSKESLINSAPSIQICGIHSHITLH